MIFFKINNLIQGKKGKKSTICIEERFRYSKFI